jgi:hypothetical protein
VNSDTAPGGSGRKATSGEGTLSDPGATILEAILGLLSAACFLYVIVKLAQDKGAGHVVLGIFVSFYPFLWKWNAGRLEMLDIMGFWTVISRFSAVFSALKSGVSVPSTSIR